MHESTGRTKETFVRLDQGGIGVKSYVNGNVLIRCLGKAIYGDFGVKGRSGEGLRWLKLKGGRAIIGAESRVGLTSPPHIDTGGMEVRLMSG